MWGRPDSGDRIAQALVLIAALFALGNGAWLLVDPLGWYDWVGTVRATGPANRHFLRDIGLAFVVSGGLLTYGAINLPMRWGAALAGTAWLALHGALHLWEVMAGLCAPAVFWQEAPGTLGPPLLALGGVGIMLARQRIAAGPVPDALFLPLARRMTYGLSPQLAEFQAMPGRVLEKYRHFVPLSVHRHAASPREVALARIGATMAADCGPCVEIAARSALRDGVPRDVVNAALAGMLADPALAFAGAVVRGTPDLAALGDAIEADRGRAVRAELALAAATAALHPLVKRGLGHARACAARPLQL